MARRLIIDDIIESDPTDLIKELLRIGVKFELDDVNMADPTEGDDMLDAHMGGH